MTIEIVIGTYDPSSAQISGIALTRAEAEKMMLDMVGRPIQTPARCPMKIKNVVHDGNLNNGQIVAICEEAFPVIR